MTRPPIPVPGAAIATLRELGPADAGAFQALRLRALAECPSAFTASVEEEQAWPVPEVARRLAPEPDHCVIGAFDGPDLVGSVGLVRESKRKLAHKAFLWGMYVAPAARGQGVGRRLVAAALERAAAMPGLRQVYLGVNAANAPAVALYEAMGFVAFGREHGFMLLDGQLHDELHMVNVLREG